MHSLLVQKDAIRVIDQIFEQVSLDRERLLPLMLQASISLNELEQVKMYLYMQYSEQNEQISQLTMLLSDPLYS